MPFGKRQTPPVNPSPPLPVSGLPPKTEEIGASRTPEHARGNVLPDSLWEGETGDVLRLLEQGSEDPSSLLPDAHSVNARLEHDRARHEARLEEMNRSVAERVPGGRMRGFSLLPDSCWNGELGRFLMMRLDLFPYDAWNMVLLPADAATAEALDMPLHPNGEVPVFVAKATEFLREAEARLRSAQEEATLMEDVTKFQETVEDTRDRVRALATAFLSDLDTAWKERDGST